MYSAEKCGCKWKSWYVIKLTH